MQFKSLHTNDELQLSFAQRGLFCRQEAGEIYPEYYVLKVDKFNDIAEDSLDEWIFFETQRNQRKL